MSPKKNKKTLLIENALSLFAEDEKFGLIEWRQALCVASGEARTVTSYLTAHKSLSRLVELGKVERLGRGVYCKLDLWKLN